ncbi:MAG TPA: hypothetical protein VEZ12_13545 [Herpetosiphonaceae bacterium]|nr:hypothetical protein [Herpetosiphonaceae bacterium]
MTDYRPTCCTWNCFNHVETQGDLCSEHATPAPAEPKLPGQMDSDAMRYRLAACIDDFAHEELGESWSNTLIHDLVEKILRTIKPATGGEAAS